MEQRQGDTLDLILYRLSAIEQNTTGLVSLETYNLKHNHLIGRVEVLETARATDRKNLRGVVVAVSVALVAPTLTNLSGIIDALGGAA